MPRPRREEDLAPMIPSIPDRALWADWLEGWRRLYPSEALPHACAVRAGEARRAAALAMRGDDGLGR